MYNDHVLPYVCKHATWYAAFIWVLPSPLCFCLTVLGGCQSNIRAWEAFDIFVKRAHTCMSWTSQYALTFTEGA